MDTVFSEIDDSRLYRVVTGMYSAQMLGTVKGKSLGLLSLEPKMADGSPVDDFEACILRDENGNEIQLNPGKTFICILLKDEQDRIKIHATKEDFEASR